MPRPEAPLPQDAVTRIYERNALIYDLVEAPMEVLLFGRARARLVRNVRGRALELGIGTGKNLPHLPRQGVELTAIDVSTRMLQRARRRAARSGVQVRLMKADAAHLPFPDGSFDVVYATFVFCSIADPQAALAEARRVLAPGGTLRLLEHQRPDPPGLAAWFDRLNPWAVRIMGANIDRPTQQSVEHAGFRSVHAVRLDRYGILRRITARVSAQPAARRDGRPRTPQHLQHDGHEQHAGQPGQAAP